MNDRCIPQGKVDAMLPEGRAHLNFTVVLYKVQTDGKRILLHEHPSSASSCQNPAMARLRENHDGGIATLNQCEYGLATPGPD